MVVSSEVSEVEPFDAFAKYKERARLLAQSSPFPFEHTYHAKYVLSLPLAYLAEELSSGTLGFKGYAKLLHPDKNRHPCAKEAFQKLL